MPGQIPIPQMSEGESFTYSRRNHFRIVDDLTNFEMSRFAGLNRGIQREWSSIQKALRKEIKDSAKQIEGFLDEDLAKAWEAGMKAGNPSFVKMSPQDKERLASERAKAAKSLESGQKQARRATNISSRQARKAVQGSLEGSAMKHPLSVLYSNGRRMPYGSHQNMVMRTHAQRSFNMGVITGASRAKVKAFEISDGPQCGLDSHDSGETANGMIVNAQDARSHLLSHPNCTRTFIPRPDLDKPSPLGTRAERIAAAAKRLGTAVKESATVQAEIQNIILDLALDADVRRLVFNTARTGVDELRKLQGRIDTYRLKRSLDGLPDFTEAELLDFASSQIDEALESGSIAGIDEWVQYILSGGKVTTIEEVVKTANGLDYYRELTIRAELSHTDLNIMNAVEGAYSEFQLRRLASMFPDGTDLGAAYRGMLQRYAPNAVRGGQSNDVAGRIRNKFLSEGLDRVQDRTTRDIADRINKSGILRDGLVSFPRLGRYLDEADMFGARLRWASRPIKIETTLVNKWRHFDRDQLRRIARQKGLPTDVRSDPKSNAAGIFSAAFREKSRQELIKALGYEKGLLTHFTVNPRGLVRLGFRFDPAYGWRRPQPTISIVSKSTPFRYRGKLNRGRLVGGEGLDGTRIRSVSHELSIVTGGSLNANLIPGINIPYASLTPGVDRIGIRLRTVLNRVNDQVHALNSADDVRLILRNVGIKEIVKQTEFMSSFVELRAMGWGWMRIGRTLSLDGEQVAVLARMTRAYFGPNIINEMRAATLLTQAERMITEGAPPDDVISVLEMARQNALRRTDGYTFRTMANPEDIDDWATMIKSPGVFKGVVADPKFKPNDLLTDIARIYEELVELYARKGVVISGNAKRGRLTVVK